MTSVRRGEVRFVSDGKETLRETYERIEATAAAYGRIKDWPVTEMDAVKITPAMWGDFYNVWAGVSLGGPEIEDGRGAE